MVISAKVGSSSCTTFFKFGHLMVPRHNKQERVSKERIFGVLSFYLLDKKIELNVYQSIDSADVKSNYLFLPFLDNTNGLSTYGGGRYMDLTVPKSDSIWLDFNTAYNPYCAYNELYSCPIVPRQNYIPLKVEAGVKRFK